MSKLAKSFIPKSFAAVVVAVVTMVSTALMSQPAQAWDETGHMVVSRIAWQNMTPKAKRIAVALLSSAPQDSSLPALLPEDARARSVREISFFLRASTWPDIVRDMRQQAKRQKYHKGNWHYINFFWDNGGLGLRPRERTDMLPEATNHCGGAPDGSDRSPAKPPDGSHRRCRVR
jgi:hypothetical protein